MLQKLITLLGDRQSFYFRLGVLLLFVGLFLGLNFLPFGMSGDGAVRYKFMKIFVERAHLLPIKYSMVGPFFSLPMWLIVSLLKPDDPYIVLKYNFILVVLLILILYLCFRNHFDKRFLLTFFFFLAFGSMFPAHFIDNYGEVFSTVCLTLGTVCLASKKLLIGWVLLILAVLNTPTLLVPLIFIILYITWESKKFRYLIIIVPVVLFLMFVENYFRTNTITAGFRTYITQDHGHQTILPYSGESGFSFPFFFGILSILFSFGKGLIFYCPGLLLIGWAWKTISDSVERKMIILWFLIVIGLILTYASWWAWYGGWFWGPRFFLFASVPASWILARLVHARQTSILTSVVLLLCITLSFWVGADGVIFNQRAMDVCTIKDYALEHLCWYVPEFSALWRPFVVPRVFSMELFLLFAIPWLYIVSPLGIALYCQIKTILQENYAHFKLSTWKF